MPLPDCGGGDAGDDQGVPERAAADRAERDCDDGERAERVRERSRGAAPAEREMVLRRRDAVRGERSVDRHCDRDPAARPA